MAPEWIPKWTGVDGHFYWECLSFTYGPPKLPKWCSKVPKVIPQVVKRCILCQKYAQSEENKRTRAGKVGAGESSKNKDCGWLEWAQNSIKNGLARGTVLGTLFFSENMLEWLKNGPRMDVTTDRCGWTFLPGELCFHLWAASVTKWCPKVPQVTPKVAKGNHFGMFLGSLLFQKIC